MTPEMQREMNREISVLQAQNQIQANSIESLNKKTEKLETFIIEQLKELKAQNEKLQVSIDDFVAKRNFTQGFIKAVVIVCSIIGFSFTAWTKLK